MHASYAERGLRILGFPCNQFGGQVSEKNEWFKNCLGLTWVSVANLAFIFTFLYLGFCVCSRSQVLRQRLKSLPKVTTLSLISSARSRWMETTLTRCGNGWRRSPKAREPLESKLLPFSPHFIQPILSGHANKNRESFWKNMIVSTIIFWPCGNVGILHENTIGKTKIQIWLY